MSVNIPTYFFAAVINSCVEILAYLSLMIVNELITLTN